MSDQTVPVTFDQMKVAIGSMIVLWSRLERELAEAIRRLQVSSEPKAVHGISKSIEAWSGYVTDGRAEGALQVQLCCRLVAMLREALVIRNLVCHGLVDIGVGHPSDRDAACLTVELGTDKRVLRLDELQEMFSWMSRAGSLIRALTSASLTADEAAASKALQHWAEFPSWK